MNVLSSPNGATAVNADDAAELAAYLADDPDADAAADVQPAGLHRPASATALLDLTAWVSAATADRAALLDYLAALDAERATVAADIAALEQAMGRVDPALAASAGVTVSKRLLAAVAGPTGPAEGTRHNRPALAACLTALGKADYNRKAPALAALLAACDGILSAAREVSPADYTLPDATRADRRAAEQAASTRWAGAQQDADALEALAVTLAGRVAAGRRGCTAADIVELIRDGGETVTEAARRIATALA